MTTLQKLEKLIYEGFKETDKKFQDTDRKFQDTDKKFKETAEESKKTEQVVRETTAQLKETDRKFKELGIDFTGLKKSVGLFAENMVRPAAARLFAERGIKLTGFYSRAIERRNGGTLEADILCVGPKHVVVIEVKFKLELQDVKDFLEELSRFFDFFTRYRGLTLHGAVAGMSIDKGVDRFAYKKGLFVLSQSGENVRLLNDDHFIPRPYKHSA